MAEVHDAGTRTTGADRKGLVATLGMWGAFHPSACCIVPLGLVTLGLSGGALGLNHARQCAPRS